MRLNPKHHVIYNGVLHEPGKPFEIKAEDAHELKRLGEIESDRIEASRIEIPDVDMTVDTDEKPKRGRPKRNEM